MNQILTANIPEIVRISLIALLFTALISGILLIVGYASQNAKLAGISVKASTISIILMLVSMVKIRDIRNCRSQKRNLLPQKRKRSERNQRK